MPKHLQVCPICTQPNFPDLFLIIIFLSLFLIFLESFVQSCSPPKPICICIANIHFHFGFMCLPSLLIGFGSFPNVQSVPRNNYIPEEICMNFVTDFDSSASTSTTWQWYFIACERRLIQSKMSAGHRIWKSEREGDRERARAREREREYIVALRQEIWCVFRELGFHYNVHINSCTVLCTSFPTIFIYSVLLLWHVPL